MDEIWTCAVIFFVLVTICAGLALVAHWAGMW
jgi:hypothetical protein